MKLFFWTLLLGFFVVPSYAKAVVYDLKQVMQDRYEKDCTIRDGYDLYEFPDIDKVLKTHVIKNKFVEEEAYVSNIFFLKNVGSKGVPIQKIEFSYGNIAKQMNQTLYFDLSTSKARESFAKIKFNFNQPKKYAGLNVEKKGKLALVQCYWPDVNFITNE